MATLQHKNNVLEQHCSDVGRDPAQIERSVGVSGDPRAIGEDLVAAGATLLTIGVGGPDYDLSTVREWLAWRDAR